MTMRHLATRNFTNWELFPLAIVLLFAQPAFSKSADDYFHGSMFKYFGGRNQEAKLEIEEGLRQYPNNERLKNLAGLLKELDEQQRQEQSQSGDPEESDENSEEGKDRKNKDSENAEKKRQAQNGKDTLGNQNDSLAENKEGKRDSISSDSSARDTVSSGRPKPGQMSKEEAERLLNSFADEEKKEQRNRRKAGKRVESEQDW